MAKPTRRQRKQLREKRVRAPGPVLLSSTQPRPHLEPDSVDIAPLEVAAPSQPTSGERHLGWWTSWPLSIRLLVFGILVLIAIGLYRRYSEDRASGNASELPDRSQTAALPEVQAAEVEKVQPAPRGSP